MLLPSSPKSHFCSRQINCKCVCACLCVCWLVRALPSTGSYFELRAGSSTLAVDLAQQFAICSTVNTSSAHCHTLHLELCVSHVKTKTTVLPPRQTVEILWLPSVANETRNAFEVHPYKQNRKTGHITASSNCSAFEFRAHVMVVYLQS